MAYHVIVRRLSEPFPQYTYDAWRDVVSNVREGRSTSYFFLFYMLRDIKRVGGEKEAPPMNRGLRGAQFVPCVMGEVV